MKAGVDRKTARKYANGAPEPQEAKPAQRHWRTRADAFAQVWPEVARQLAADAGAGMKMD